MLLQQISNSLFILILAQDLEARGEPRAVPQPSALGCHGLIRLEL